ncbi:MAG: GNAT family N-acetyltransferase [Ruminococcaceae bacterium]|nr:GNAT family N-acetyltransferase [Oscillospiraceae bacterium]
MEITRLKKENYDELIALLNEVFSNHNKRESDFEKDLPKMCVRDDEHMQKHFGIFADGRLVAAIGVYPLRIDIAGERLLFSTVGNVATHPDYEGRGYMNALLEHAMSELDSIGADASRLGGLRHRYNRFGYEMCGSRYSVSFNGQNRKNWFSGKGDDVIFKKIEASDLEMLKRACKLQKSCMLAVERSAENKVSAERLIELGRCFGRAMKKYIAETEAS